MENENSKRKDIDKIKAEYNRLKLRLESMQKRRRKFSIFIGFFSAIMLSIIFICIYNSMYLGTMNFWTVVLYLVLAAACGVCMSLYGNILLEVKESRIRQEMLEYEAENIQEEVKEDFFEKSIKLSYKYLDQYYLQTRIQSQRGFGVTIGVSIFGAILIAIGIIAVFIGKAEPSYVTCGAGVITEFVATVFFYMYNKTNISMSNYHNKLVFSQNISIALKVTETLPDEEKAKTKNLIITELLKDINANIIKHDD